MADGYARVTGRVGTCMVVPGPGLLNATAALSTAYSCNSPVLCVTGQIQSDMIEFGRGLLHEIPNQLGMIRSVTKWAGRAMTPMEIPGLVREAFTQMNSGRPRPVEIEIPPDVLFAVGDPSAPVVTLIALGNGVAAALGFPAFQALLPDLVPAEDLPGAIALSSAQFNLGLMYFDGQGVPQDFAEAADWFRKSARQGFVKAQYNLGELLATGKGIRKDYVEAHMWLNLCAASGNTTCAAHRDLIAKKMKPAAIAQPWLSRCSWATLWTCPKTTGRRKRSLASRAQFLPLSPSPWRYSTPSMTHARRQDQPRGAPSMRRASAMTRRGRPASNARR